MKTKSDRRFGNHIVRHHGDVREFYYHITCICKVDDGQELFAIDASYGSASTTKACNEYCRQFKLLGYTEVGMDDISWERKAN
jgi:hypothetical protein